MSRLGYALFDADNHFYETRDCFTRHIEAANAELAVRPVVGDDGVGVDASTSKGPQASA